MLYDFECECKNIEEKDIPISQYDELKDKQICSKCGKKMSRVFGSIGGVEYKMSGCYDTDVRGISFR